MNKYEVILNKIKEYDVITLFGHINPDGDSYGSQLGLKRFIKTYFKDKRVYLLGSGFKRSLSYFDELDNPSEEEIKASLGIVLDVSDTFRIEDQRFSLAKDLVRIDHHIGSDEVKFESAYASNVEASSTSQMICELILDNGYALTKEIAEPLFMGIVTDSGRFQFLSSSKRMFAILDKIMETCIDFQAIFDFLYESDAFLTRLKGYILYNFKSSKNGVAYIVLDKNTLKELGADFNLASTQVNALAGMKEHPIWVSFAEDESGLVRVELRSKSYNVQQVAIMFNGGGHLKASGLRLNDLNDHLKVVAELDKLLEK